MFVDLESVGFIAHTHHFRRKRIVVIPSGKGGAIAEVIQQGAAPAGLFVEPAVGFHFRGRRDFNFVRGVVKRSTVAVVVVHLLHAANVSFVEVAWRSRVLGTSVAAN